MVWVFQRQLHVRWIIWVGSSTEVCPAYVDERQLCATLAVTIADVARHSWHVGRCEGHNGPEALEWGSWGKDGVLTTTSNFTSYEPRAIIRRVVIAFVGVYPPNSDGRLACVGESLGTRPAYPYSLRVEVFHFEFPGSSYEGRFERLSSYGVLDHEVLGLEVECLLGGGCLRSSEFFSCEEIYVTLRSAACVLFKDALEAIHALVEYAIFP